jgi:hypothetical protein
LRVGFVPLSHQQANQFSFIADQQTNNSKSRAIRVTNMLNEHQRAKDPIISNDFERGDPSLVRCK